MDYSLPVGGKAIKDTSPRMDWAAVDLAARCVKDA